MLLIDAAVDDDVVVYVALVVAGVDAEFSCHALLTSRSPSAQYFSMK